jgi:hypothetical protein
VRPPQLATASSAFTGKRVHPSFSHQRRNSLDDFAVFGHLLAHRKAVFGSNQSFDLWIPGDERWIRGLPIEEADEFLGTLRLAGIAAVEQNLGLTGTIRHGNLPAIVNNRRRSSFHRQAERFAGAGVQLGCPARRYDAPRTSFRLMRGPDHSKVTV